MTLIYHLLLTALPTATASEVSGLRLPTSSPPFPSSG